MAVTPNFSIPLYTTSDTAKLDTLLNGQATAIDTNLKAAMTAQEGRFVPAVANQAARDALFPSPVQGNRVFRVDAGYEEAYYAAYNATTNPNGVTPAGWYPTGGAFPYGGATYNTTQNVAANTSVGVNLQLASKLSGGFTLTSNALKIPVTGRYQARGSLYTYSIAGGSNRMVKIMKNAVEVARFTQSGPWTIGPALVEFDANANDLITLATDGDSAITLQVVTEIKESLSVRYIGPKVGA